MSQTSMATVVHLRRKVPELLVLGEKMRDVLARVRKIARSSHPVLIFGPSGSGKELIAHTVHAQSDRHDKPFLAINCAALNPTLIESELFGHVKGAFTGAIDTREGAFEACRDGTLFLDELGELPLELQPKLLRVLESGAVRKIGGALEEPMNTRVVAATNRDLAALVAQGLFREDLYHRLMVLDVEIPALADRREEIVPLAQHFLGREHRFSAEAERALLSYSWPGNVRELRNVVVRATVLSDESVIRAEDLQLPRAREAAPLSIDANDQREQLIRVISECGNNRAEAARRLGISRSTLHAQLRRLGMPLKFIRG